MKKLESLWESLKTNGKVSKTEVKVLTLEERTLEKVKKIQAIRKAQYREVTTSPIIPIDKIQETKEFVEIRVKRVEEWRTYEKNKEINLEKEDFKSFREELTKKFGKGYNSQRLMILFNEFKALSNTGEFNWIDIMILPYITLPEIEYKIKENIIKNKKRILEKLLLYSISLEENRVLLN